MDEIGKIQREAASLKTKGMLRGLTGAFETEYTIISLGEETFFELKLKDKAPFDMLLRVVKRAGLHTLPESGRPHLLPVITEKGIRIAIIDGDRRLMYLPCTEDNRELIQTILWPKKTEPAKIRRPIQPKKPKTARPEVKIMRIKELSEKKAKTGESETVKRIRERLRRLIADSDARYNSEKDTLIFIIPKGIPFKAIAAMGYPLTEGPAEGSRRHYYITENKEILAAIWCTGDRCNWITFQKAKGHKGFVKEFLGKMKPQ